MTKITYGDGPNFTSFTVDDPEEIALWASEYRRCMEFSRHFYNLVPLNEQAGFKPIRDEFSSFSSCLCLTALRFYRDDALVLELKGDLARKPEIDSGMRNIALHHLIMFREWEADKTRRAAQREAEGGDALAEDPFAEEKTIREDKE